MPRKSKKAVAVRPTSRPPNKLAKAEPKVKHLPLPPELQDRIRQLVLISGGENIAIRRYTSHIADQWLSLLLVSKQTCLKAFHIVYCYNNFQFFDVNDLTQLLKNIGYACRRIVAHITLYEVDDKAVLARRALQRCSNLRYLNVWPNIGLWRMKIDTFRERIAFFRHTRGLEEVGFLGIDDERIDLAQPFDRTNWTQVTDRVLRVGTERLLVELADLRYRMMRPRLRKHTSKAHEKGKARAAVIERRSCQLHELSAKGRMREDSTYHSDLGRLISPHFRALVSL